MFGNNTYEDPAHTIKFFPDGSVNMHPLISTSGALQTSSYGSSLLTVMDSWLDLTSNTPENMKEMLKMVLKWATKKRPEVKE